MWPTAREVASSVYDYPSGEAGILLDPKDPNLARQNPADYIEGFYQSVRGASEGGQKRPRFLARSSVVGIGVDTTGSTPIPVDRQGTPLALHPEFREQSGGPRLALEGPHGLRRGGGNHREGPRDAATAIWPSAAASTAANGTGRRSCTASARQPEGFRRRPIRGWNWPISFRPSHRQPDPDTLPRGICAAGHKAMYNDQWGGLPSKRFLREAWIRRWSALPIVMPRRPCGRSEGGRADRGSWPARSACPPGVPVAVGAFDAHMGAVGAGIKPGTLVKIIGTSTCDMMVAPMDNALPDIPGLCGIVPGSIIPGMYGLEAGQSAVGDIFNWFVKHLTPAQYAAKGDPHANLTREADKLRPGESGLLALDWNNGNRTILVDPLLDRPAGRADAAHHRRRKSIGRWSRPRPSAP